MRTNSREVELGRSMRDWLGRMGLSWGGETGRALREQAARIAACSLKFWWAGEDAEGWSAGRFVRSGLRFHDRLTAAAADPRQAELWEDRVVLDEVFWDALRQHPVPLRCASTSSSSPARAENCTTAVTVGQQRRAPQEARHEARRILPVAARGARALRHERVRRHRRLRARRPRRAAGAGDCAAWPA
jgi:hypothetical protein